MGAKSYLIVSRSFYPGNSPRANRTTELAKELSRQGHQVTVLTPHHPEQDALADQFGLTVVDLGPDRLPEIPVQWSGRSNYLLRGLRRGLQMAFEYPSIELVWRVRAALRRLPHYDVLISIAVPHPVHWGTALAFKKHMEPADVWLADCGDPFMGEENDSFSHPFYFGYVEKAFCRKADAIVVPVEGAQEAYYPDFRDKIHVIPQGFRFADYDDIKTMMPVNDGVVRFGYAGMFIPGRRDPTRFLEHLAERSEAFEFHVFSKNPALVEPFASCDPRIIIRDFLPRDGVLRELAAMNFLVNFENIGNRQIPSKLIDYWLCQRPILNLKSDELRTEVIDEFFQGQYQQALAIDSPARYEISNVVRQFDQLASQILATKSAKRGKS